MMDETATSSGPRADEPVINVIEPDAPPIPDPQGAGAQRVDQTAADALAARRRREFDAARARLRDQAIQADAPSQAAEQQRAPQQEVLHRSSDTSTMRWAPLGNPPEMVRKRYLRAGNQYFLKDAPHRLAFEDIGPYLVTEHNRPDVVESMVDMAHAKAWGRIRVSGHEQFRREVWVQATLIGIEVSGYEPKAVDVARLTEARRDRMTNRIDVTQTPPAAPVPANRPEAPDAAPGPTESQAAQPARRDAPRQPEARAPAPPAPVEPSRTAPTSETGPRVAESEGAEQQRYMGELVEHGGAPYQHNPARSDSYYVVYRDTGGADHVLWGVDLERAVAESGALAGQQVMLENLGRRLVTVMVPVVDAMGNVIGEEEKEVYRNTWQVDVVGQERTQSRPGATERQGEAGRSETALPPTPEQAQAARRREPSVTSPEERAVQMAVLTAAMRQQGFSERSIARVQQRAQRLLTAFESEGVTVPRPRVFDPEAPSTRSRRTRTAAERVPTREVERGPSEPAPPSL
ncbi:LPD7 domain-containing protein [Paraburkholderia sp. DD10]|uniref:LPD7 domain-containing protein n=1 Tax=Paraburkholderia sp. DD10 TaxID=3409691 RepID=UPI003BA123AA